MRIVLDASIAASWCFDDEDDPVANLAFDLLEEGTTSAIAPLLFWFELRNVILVGLRRGRIDSDNVKAVLAQRGTIALATLDQAPARAAVADGVALIGP